MEVLSAKKLAQDEQERSYFGFSSTDFYLDYCDFVQGQIRQALDGIEQTLDEAAVKDESTTDKIRELYRLYLDRAKPALSQLKESLQTIFAVPPAENLEHFDCSPEAIGKLSEEVEQLEREYMRKKQFIQVGQTAQGKFNKIKPIMDTVKTMLDTPCSSRHEELDEAVKNLEQLEIASLETGFSLDLLYLRQKAYFK